MINTFKISQLFLVLLILLSFSCKKFVEIDPPISQLVTTTVFTNNGSATSALLSIYQQMYTNTSIYNIIEQTGLVGDELTNYNAAHLQLYTNTLSPLDTYASIWNNIYSYIYQANSIIEALNSNSSLNAKVQQQLLGEAKFIRAFWNFYLVNYFGDIPLVLSTNYITNRNLSRTNTEQVYQQILRDLTDAVNLLNSNFIDGSDTAVTSDRVRPTKWAASAFLARVYLYTKDYANAELQANNVINNGAIFTLENDLNKVFLANSSEAIWQLATPMDNGSNGGINTTEGNLFILQSQPTNESLSSQLMSAFETGDNRRNLWIDSFVTSSPSNTYYYSYKYKVYIDADPSNTEEYTMLLRLSEQYLIRAEARIQQDKIAQGIADLNVLRTRARLPATTDIPNPLPNLSISLSKTDALKAVLHERQVELFTEGGHRWFDMIRMGYADGVMGAPGNVTQFKGGMWNSNWRLFPIPQTEINNDPNLKQNEGYY